MENELLNVSEIKISYSPKFKMSERPVVTESTLAASILREHWEDIEYYESGYVLLLNRSNRVLGIRRISVGGIHSCLMDPKIIFQAALKANASAIILAHNHPSGNLTASEEDKSITNKIQAGAKLLDIAFLDHVILTPESYLSMNQDGLF